MEEISSAVRQHKVTMINRKSCTMTGIKDVLSFDLREVLLETEQGMLTIHGDDLHVSRLSLDKGEVDVEGQLDNFNYSEVPGNPGKGESFLSRIFG